MKILALCPGNLATGGTEGIHKLISELGKYAETGIVYVNGEQPEAFKEYHCKSVKKVPADFDGWLIIPEVWANDVIKYKCKVAVLWQGIDVYNWHTPIPDRGKFLQRKDVLHITMSEYGLEHLKKLGLQPVKIPDLINEDFYNQSESKNRNDLVLFNPTQAKMTLFQEIVMARANTELGIKFMPLAGYTREALKAIMQHSKLYIDFGAFSGRERMPREAVMCGCCIITSTNGTAGYYEDNKIPDAYKFKITPENIDKAIKKIKDVLKDYEHCRPDFSAYEMALRYDRKIYPEQVRSLYAIFNNYPGA